MVRIASYTLVDRIHDGAETCIYRAVRDADRLPVILKTPNVPYPSRRQLARLQHEYAMLKKAGGRGAVLPIELIQTADVVALVTEDWGGQTLHSLIAAGALGWREAAAIGLHIADALAALHDQGILHKDLWFSNNLENQAGWSGRGNGEEGCRATDYRAQRTARQGGPLRVAGGAGRREREGGSGSAEQEARLSGSAPDGRGRLLFVPLLDLGALLGRIPARRRIGGHILGAAREGATVNGDRGARCRGTGARRCSTRSGRLNTFHGHCDYLLPRLLVNRSSDLYFYREEDQPVCFLKCLYQH